MRVFVTGATGFVGSAVVQELLNNGHTVLGLARSDTKAVTLAATGAEVLRGDLSDLESLRAGAAQTDAVIHTAFNHDFSKFVENCAQDKLAIETLGAALEGSQRPLLVTSGVALLSFGRTATEQDVPPAPGPTTFPRWSEASAAALISRGINASVLRLPPSTHGDGDYGFVPILIGIAREKGVAAYVGDGHNRWPATHRFDAAVCYRLAIEYAAAHPDSGFRNYHAVAEEGIPFKDITTVIGRRLNLPIVRQTPEEAYAHFGWFARFAATDVPSSSAQTRKLLGWTPTHRGLIEDLDDDRYIKV